MPDRLGDFIYSQIPLPRGSFLGIVSKAGTMQFEKPREAIRTEFPLQESQCEGIQLRIGHSVRRDHKGLSSNHDIGFLTGI